MCCGSDVFHPHFGCLLFPPTTAAAAAAFEFVSLFLLLETNRELNARVNSTRPPSFTSVRPYVCVCVVVVSFNLVKLACVTQVKAVWSVSRITRNSSESRRVRGTTATTRKKEGKKRNQQTIHTRHWTYVSYQVKEEEEEENSFSFQSENTSRVESSRVGVGQFCVYLRY